MSEPQQDSHDESHQPSPTIWPIGFAIGIAVILVGLIINPVWISTTGVLIAVIFGFMWAREATAELRGGAAHVEPERRDLVPATDGEGPPERERFPRSRFLEASTLGLGALIGGIVTVPVAGFVLLPPFVGQKKHRVDLGPISEYAEGQWYITTFVVDPEQAAVARRT